MNLRPTHLLSLFAAISMALAAPATAHAAPPPNGSEPGTGPFAVGLTTDQKLVMFRVDSISTLEVVGKISGLDGDAIIVGIDLRIQDGTLYGVGNAGGVYTFDGPVGTKVSQLTVALEGTAFGVDFNPAADLLRIVSNTGQNLTHNLGDNTTTEYADLTYPPNTAAVSGVSAVAYTNNDLDAATGTTLFDIDTALDQEAIQSPPNAGLLVRVGALGVDADEDAGFDIYTTLNNGVAAGNAGYATLAIVDGAERDYGIFTVNLTTGAAAQIGDFPHWAQVTDLAVQVG